MTRATETNHSPAWSVENTNGHSVFLLPCECCTATTMTVDVDAAVVRVHIDDIDMLEELRDSLTAVIEFQKGRPLPARGGEDEEPDAGHRPRRWEGHAPNGIREAFHLCVDDWLCDEATAEDMEAFRHELVPALSACTDILPASYCDMLELPHGSTYAEAVEELRSEVS
jgi:hypothetical protein